MHSTSHYRGMSGGAGHLVDGYTGSTLYTQHLDCRGTVSGDIIITLNTLSSLVECLDV